MLIARNFVCQQLAFEPLVHRDQIGMKNKVFSLR